MAKWENIVTDWKIEYKTVWNYEIKVDKDGYVYIDYLKPVEKRGLYDLYIDNHIDIPEGISKDSPCYKQFMKEKEMNK